MGTRTLYLHNHPKHPQKTAAIFGILGLRVGSVFNQGFSFATMASDGSILEVSQEGCTSRDLAYTGIKVPFRFIWERFQKLPCGAG